jgi:hypothetical protein
VHRALLAAGGLPLTLPQLPDAIESALDALDALVLAPRAGHRARDATGSGQARCWRRARAAAREPAAA